MRRMHDSDRSGWRILVAGIPVVGLWFIVLATQASTPGVNRFGAGAQPSGSGKNPSLLCAACGNLANAESLFCGECGAPLRR
ncbi:MAG: DUF805 domain-containing protein [Chloroflexi bacterium]|nr:DUF805 domain-containing protein [Chloroflexota bacterium]MDA1173271.1 DUF805 domain-containing protein [Chloroflexota bacterium]